MTLKKNVLLNSVFLLGLLGGLLLGSCKNNQATSKSSYVLTGDTVADGKNLVQINCTKCHALVPVNALPKDVWRYHTLPSMGRYFGERYMMDNYFKTDKDTAGLTLLEWRSIVVYYQKMAPDSLTPVKAPVPLINDWAGFKLKTPPRAIHPAYTTMVAIDSVHHKIYSSDYIYANVQEWDPNLKVRESASLPSSAVSTLFKTDSAGGSKLILSCIGRMEPVDFPNGRVVSVNINDKNDKTDQTLLASDLARPVQTLEGDFNKDGLKDMVILGQGNLSGGVYFFTQNKDHTYTQRANISNKPGAVQGIVGDFNHDGWPDLMVLFGTGDEGLWLYLNDHKGGFTAKNLLRFPPIYSSTSFQLADVDHDGKPDLIYTCGYNFRDSRVLKPYHGLYIFKNMGNWNFKQQYFYPINGCSKAIAADFSGNGNLDIVTCAFFADLQHNPAEGFIYFKYDKPFSYKPYAVPVSKYGRWISMDVGDYNNDGKPDIILGNYSSGFVFQRDLQPFWDKNLPFIVLENHIKK